MIIIIIKSKHVLCSPIFSMKNYNNKQYLKYTYRHFHYIIYYIYFTEIETELIVIINQT